MTDDELKAVLIERISAIEERMTAACQRVKRERTAITLVAITKTVSIRVAEMLPELGIVDLGENRPQELWKKAAAIPGIRWHFTGHLQRNKIDPTLALTTLMHTLDSERLALAVHEFGMKRGQPVPVLLEVNCSREAAKGGFTPEELPAVVNKLMPLSGLRLDGLMTMAAHAENPEECRPAFVELRGLRDSLCTQTGLTLPQLSMGMSNDFEIAIEEGATFIRLGTTLFAGLETE